MKTKKRIVKGSVKPKYTTSIKILGRIYTSSASDIRTAIETLPVGKVAKGVSILEVTHGENRKSVILPPPTTFRVFSSHGIIKEIAMKNLLLKLGGI